ncbi:hypothetical protein DSO57_1002158 [Entomophthora muscae]|uniref:Uncharacterized protein n=1 Tax=Entomophthora muscae TaxID=34485 RepID=A0ACC2SLV3_9FUNG|nr:hypothetical protein DSO57_1002158 [Entomophthora muscae]
MKFLCFLFAVVESKLFSLEWKVQSKWMAPDNHAVPGMTINGQFPGPAITLEVGDTVEINVINEIDHPLTIHWHGLLQKASPAADGVPFVTQDSIKSNNSYVYRFTVENQTGTYWYHAHTKMDSDFIFGSLVVKEPKFIIDKAIQLDSRFKYDEERVILLSNIWHKPIDEIYKGLISNPYVGLHAPQSILTNGATFDEWAQPANGTLPFNTGYSVINVKPSTRYRLRVIASQGHSYFALHIPDHKFTVIEADGTFVKPFESDFVYINSGMRYSVIIETKDTPQNVYIHTSIVGEGNEVNNGVAILHYDGAPDPTPLRKKKHIPTNKNLHISSWFEDQLSTLFTQEYPVPATYNRSLIARLQFVIDNGFFRFHVNDVFFSARNTTLLPSVMDRTCRPEPGVYQIESNNQGVQLVIQSFALDNSYCATHPWHVHGHSFYVVARGSGVYDPKTHDAYIESQLSKDPIIRDTFTFFPYDVPTTKDNTKLPAASGDPKNPKLHSCGWSAIRFKANNPGAWLMHCHYTAHMIMGMQLIMNELPQRTPYH